MVQDLHSASEPNQIVDLTHRLMKDLRKLLKLSDSTPDEMLKVCFDIPNTLVLLLRSFKAHRYIGSFLPSLDPDLWTKIQPVLFPKAGEASRRKKRIMISVSFLDRYNVLCTAVYCCFAHAQRLLE